MTLVTTDEYVDRYIWPKRGMISIVGRVLDGGKIDWSVALVLDSKEVFGNTKHPEYDIRGAIEEVHDLYDQWLLNRLREEMHE